MSEPAASATTKSTAWPPRRLAKLGCLLPVGAIVIFLAVLVSWPRGRHQEPTDLQGWLFLGSLALIPLTTVVGVVLSIMVVMRGRRSPGSDHAGTSAMAIVGIVVAVACLAVGIGLVWALLVGASRFR